MRLRPGTRLGPYEILSLLGAGGMGEVYRARDSRLGREVAIKVLPGHLTENAELRARFEREAKTISSLSHPNICTLYDVGREEGTDFLVMELIEGETLATRLARGPMPLAETLRIGSEIADALDRAHRAGVVHRDLKPGNVMLTRAGSKLMDFGLARTVGMIGTTGSGTLTQSPTMSQPLTAEGTIVGTFQYMSPEQLEGEETDERSDIWALGCVLYEMSTGQRAFEGRSQASLVASIMSAEPVSIAQLSPTAPPALDRLVRACLAKESVDRIQSAHDVKLQLSWIREGGSEAGVTEPVAHRRTTREHLAWVVAAIALVCAAVLAYLYTRPVPSVPPVQAYLKPPEGVLYSSSVDRPLPLAISPDGSLIAFCAREGEGPDKLWVRSLNAEDARALPGTEGAQGPFFSPDGRSLAFYSDWKLRRIDVDGGPVTDLAEDVDPRGGSWNEDDVILFATGPLRHLSKVSANGGPVTAVTALDSTVGEATHRYPHFLPDGKRYLFLSRAAFIGAGEKPMIYAGEFGSNERTPVLEVASNVVYASGYLLYYRGKALVAQRFDVSSLRVQGGAIPLIDDIRVEEGFSRAVFAASENGVLVCMTGSNQTQARLRWLSRDGKPLGDVGEPGDFTYGGTPNISPDGKSAVLAITARDQGTSDIWLFDLESGRRRKLTVDTLHHPYAMWLPDGRSVAVATNQEGRSCIDVVAIDGTRTRRVVDEPDFAWPVTVWKDSLIYVRGSWKSSNDDLLVVSLAESSDPAPFAATGVNENLAQFSPDGRFVAYVSDETGRRDVFVTTFPANGGRWQVSQSGGSQPRWSRDGRELFFKDTENYLVAVEVLSSDGAFQMGGARRLFQFHGATADYWGYDVSADDQRFLITAPLDEDLASPVTVMTDWTRRVSER